LKDFQTAITPLQKRLPAGRQGMTAYTGANAVDLPAGGASVEYGEIWLYKLILPPVDKKWKLC
jgi:hypothetical protein